MPSPATMSPVSESTGRITASPLMYIKLVLVAACWGGTFIAGRILAQVLPMMASATGRFAVAAVLLLILAWKMDGGLPRLNLRQAVATALLGLTGVFLYNVCFFGALTTMPAGRTALFVALNPVVTALLSALLLGERLGKIKWAGIGVAFFGAAIVITRGDLPGAAQDLSQSLGRGELLMLCAITAWAAYTLIGRRVMNGLTPIAATTYAVLWGLAFLAGGAGLDIQSLKWSALTWQAAAAIFYLGAFGTVVGFVWYNQAVTVIGASRTAVFNNLVPVFGVLLSSILLAEPVLISMLVGGAITITGVMMTNR